MFDRGLISLSDDLDILVFQASQRSRQDSLRDQKDWSSDGADPGIRATASAFPALASRELFQALNMKEGGLIAGSSIVINSFLNILTYIHLGM